MAIKNIEMSVYNGSSYDTLLPVTSSENVTIASAISGLFGLGADSTLTDILQKLSNAVIWDGSSTELPNGSSIVTGARIETGSYVGTGTYGASNPCSLTFDFEPKMVVLISENTHVSGVSGFDNCNYISLSFNYIPINISFTTIYKNNYSEIRTNIYASCYSNLNLNVFQYYSSYYREIDAVVYQFNSLNITYYYWAIG